MKRTYNIVDMFCGAGGESTGIMQAARELNIKVNLLAINHWQRAIETHSANHPGAEHLCESVERIDPTQVVWGGKVDLLWASPACTHHSIARGGRPRSDQSRADAWLILRWLSELYVERVIIENVPEFLSWGPLDEGGRPVKSEKGKTFLAFVSSLQSMGYAVEWKILTAADYGDPTTRRRLFVQAVKGPKRIAWPRITHMKSGGNLAGLQPWIPARDIIDWSIPGTSIFNRKRPLADSTLRRIASSGIEKYWGEYAKPFISRFHGGKGFEKRNHTLNNPLPTLDTSGRYALVEPLIMEYYGNGGTEPVGKPLKTITTKDRFALLKPFTIDNHTCGTSLLIKDPLRTVTSKGWFGLIESNCHSRFDITFRMLKNHELKRAQGFPDDYILTGNNAEQTKQIGNAVPVKTAKALALTVMSE